MNDQVEGQGEAARVESGLRASLEQHGHGFQAAVEEEAVRLHEAGESPWEFILNECAVKSDAPTHIDFVMRRRSPPAYMVVECKRVNPSFSTWCFLKSKRTNRDAVASSKNALALTRNSETGKVRARGLQRLSWSGPAAHIGLVLKSDRKGDPNPRSMGKSAITEAVTQVLRGASGLANDLYTRPVAVAMDPTCIVPVIFTTAELWVSDAELEKSDLDTGSLDGIDLAPRRVDRVWYRHNVTPDLRPAVPFSQQAQDLHDAAELEAARSVAIVSPAGLASFLGWHTIS